MPTNGRNSTRISRVVRKKGAVLIETHFQTVTFCNGFMSRLARARGLKQTNPAEVSERKQGDALRRMFWGDALQVTRSKANASPPVWFIPLRRNNVSERLALLHCSSTFQGCQSEKPHYLKRFEKQEKAKAWQPAFPIRVLLLFSYLKSPINKHFRRFSLSKLEFYNLLKCKIR